MKKITKNVGGYIIDWFSDAELIEIFQPESKQVMKSALAERQEEYKTTSEEIKAIFLKVRKESPRDVWFYEILAEKMPELIPKLLKVENHINRLKWQINSLKRKTSKKYTYKISIQEKIQIAREYPIAELARSKLDLTPSGKNYTCLCPAHNDTRPSMYIYTETNSFVCFVCDFKGDVITLAMHLYSLSFLEAIEMLQH